LQIHSTDRDFSKHGFSFSKHVRASRHVFLGPAYQSSKKRPILVKFRSIWDRRLVLSGARNLNDDILFRRKVFINADEPPEERRRNTLRRLKRRAESSGQQVDVTSDGILIIGGTACFSVRDGFLNRQVLVSSRGIANDNVDMSRPVASPRNG